MSIHPLQTLRRHHEERVSTRILEQEIASYRSEADRHDLEALLARYADDETAAIRRIMAAQAA